MKNVRYYVAAIGPKGGHVAGCFFYPLTDEGLKKAKAKRNELLAKYLHATIVLDITER